MKVDLRDRVSPVWLRIKEQMQADADALRRELAHDQPHDTTVKLRGRIAQLEDLIQADQDLEPVPEDPAPA